MTEINPYEKNIKRSGNATACYNILCILSILINMTKDDKEMIIID